MLSTSCQKVVKKLSKSCQKVVKSCQKVVKKLQKVDKGSAMYHWSFYVTREAILKKINKRGGWGRVGWVGK
jgi:hypothetical protein